MKRCTIINSENFWNNSVRNSMSSVVTVINKIWTRNYIFVCLASLIAGTMHMLNLATLPMYAIILGGNSFTMGLVTSVYFVAALCTRPLIGKLLDQKGRKIILLLGIGTITMACLFYEWAANVWILLGLRFLNGIGYSMMTTAAATAIADLVPPTRLAEGIGYYSLTLTISIALGPALGLNLIAWGGYKSVFICLTGLGLLSFFILSLVDYEKDLIKSTRLIDKKVALMERSALPMASVMLLIALGISGILTFLPTYSIERHIENISLFYLFYALAMLIPRAFLGRVVDRYGGDLVILPAIIVQGTCLLLLAFGHSFVIITIAALCFGIGFGALQPTINSMILKKASAARRGAANATFLTMSDIGFCLGTALWGYLVGAKGFTFIYCASAGCIVTAYIIYLGIKHTTRADKSIA